MSVTTVTAPRLHQRRCIRHPAREAAVRCPSCQEFFCRECVVEHDGKLLCAGCLAQLSTPVGTRGERAAHLRRIATTVAGGLALWATLHGLGVLLAKIPSDVHDGTVWKKAVEDSPG